MLLCIDSVSWGKITSNTAYLRAFQAGAAYGPHPAKQEFYLQFILLYELKNLALTMLQGIVEFGNDGLLLSTYHSEW